MTAKEIIALCEKAGMHYVNDDAKGLSYSKFKPQKKWYDADGKNIYNPDAFFSNANGKNSVWSNAMYVIAEVPEDYGDISVETILDEWDDVRTDKPDQLVVLADSTSDEWYVYDKTKNCLGSIKDILSSMPTTSSKPLPIQVIFFGAPGTGKSFAIDDNSLIKSLPKENKIRTMFHPESDYASFVGCYKPIMEKQEPLSKTTPIGLPVDSCMYAKGEGEDATDASSVGKYLPLYLFSHNDCLNLEDAIKTRREEIVYKFTPQAFTIAYIQAWKEYFSASAGKLPNNVYLIIEEINRGNCAQIFGDLFQLLDRDEDNFSKYAIDADHDLRKYLKENLKNQSGAYLKDAYTSNSDFESWQTNNNKVSIVNGDTLCLPPNLYIVASMNTSDQGLFPMDSAFKRRWQWQYIPIKNEGKGHKIVLDEIKGVSTGIKPSSVGATLPLEYDWWSFLENVNFKIEDANSSSDKKLGYWFVKPSVKGSTEIDIETFTCKVISYLWNDVFKNVPEGESNIFTFEYLGSEKDPRKKRDTHPFDSFFDPATGLIDTQMVKDFLDQDKWNILQLNVADVPGMGEGNGSGADDEQSASGSAEQNASADETPAENIVEGAENQQ